MPFAWSHDSVAHHSGVISVAKYNVISGKSGGEASAVCARMNVRGSRASSRNGGGLISREKFNAAERYQAMPTLVKYCSARSSMSLCNGWKSGRMYSRMPRKKTACAAPFSSG